MSEVEKNEFVPIPLPFQIPEPPDLSQLPIAVIHSATVETLISQTEDLSARLKVQIRRNAVLERKSLEMEEKAQGMEKELRSLREQHELFNEKDSLLNEKIRDLQSKVEHEKKELELLEVRYSELYNLGQKKENDAKEEIERLSADLKDLQRLLPLETENFQFREQIAELTQKIQNQSQTLQSRDQNILQLNEQLSVKTQTIQQLEQHMHQLQTQVDYATKSIEEKAELENLLILKEREKEHQLSQLNNEVMVLRQEFKNMQMLTGSAQTEKQQAEAQLKSCEETINSLSRDNAELEKQIENLQNLWYKLQAEFEKEKTKNLALTKLNRELSVELQRRQTTSSFEDDYLKSYLQKPNEI